MYISRNFWFIHLFFWKSEQKKYKKIPVVLSGAAKKNSWPDRWSRRRDGERRRRGLSAEHPAAAATVSLHSAAFYPSVYYLKPILLCHGFPKISCCHGLGCFSCYRIIWGNEINELHKHCLK
jgi:hypothetical protein